MITEINPRLTTNHKHSNKKNYSIVHKSNLETAYSFRDYLKENVFTNYRTMLLMVSIVIFAAFLLFSSTKAEGSSTPEYKYYKSIEVQAGDTLWSIAEKYMADDYSSVNDYIQEVKYINSIETNQITSGKSLVIPYYSTKQH